MGLFNVLFEKKTELTFDEFGDIFKPKISDLEFKWLSIKVFDD